jgi:hypothetical protein
VWRRVVVAVNNATSWFRTESLTVERWAPNAAAVGPYFGRFSASIRNSAAGFCRDKEDAEKAAADILTKAASSKAVTDRAVRLGDQMRPIRERPRQAGPMV